jgi:ADP-L-glycero-D-manno-heptose 6-epimerase
MWGAAMLSPTTRWGTDQIWRNLAKRQIADLVPPTDLDRSLDARKFDAVMREHVGVRSSRRQLQHRWPVKQGSRCPVRI